MVSGTWTERWHVPKSSGDGCWVVSRKDTGEWGCSCPVWTFPKNKKYDSRGKIIREECHHIRQIKGRTADVDSAEVIAKLGSLATIDAFGLLEEAYIKAGYYIIAVLSSPGKEALETEVERFKHDKGISMVELNHPSGYIEILIKDLY